MKKQFKYLITIFSLIIPAISYASSHHVSLEVEFYNMNSNSTYFIADLFNDNLYSSSYYIPSKNTVTNDNGNWLRDMNTTSNTLDSVIVMGNLNKVSHLSDKSCVELSYSRTPLSDQSCPSMFPKGYHCWGLYIIHSTKSDPVLTYKYNGSNNTLYCSIET